MLYSVQRNPLTWAMQCWRSQERNVAWGSTTRTFNNALHLQMFYGFLQSWQQRDLLLILCIVIKPGFVFKRAFKGLLMTPTPNTTVDLNKHGPRWGLAPVLRLSAEVTNWRVCDCLYSSAWGHAQLLLNNLSSGFLFGFTTMQMQLQQLGFKSDVIDRPQYKPFSWSQVSYPPSQGQVKCGPPPIFRARLGAGAQWPSINFTRGEHGLRPWGSSNPWEHSWFLGI